jgi:hypothetical protein
MGGNVLTPVDQGGEVEDGVDEEDVIPAPTHMAMGKQAQSRLGIQ